MVREGGGILQGQRGERGMLCVEVGSGGLGWGQCETYIRWRLGWGWAVGWGCGMGVGEW